MADETTTADAPATAEDDKPKRKGKKEVEANREADAVAIFDCPRYPDTSVRIGDQQYVKFTDGSLHASQAEADVIRASGTPWYIEADPKFANNPIECPEPGCPTLSHSREAFSLHSRFAHLRTLRVE